LGFAVTASDASSAAHWYSPFTIARSVIERSLSSPIIATMRAAYSFGGVGARATGSAWNHPRLPK
jgi:hypothetical protein